VTKTRAELQADPASVDLSELRDTYAYNARGALVYLPHLDASGPTNLTRDHHDQLLVPPGGVLELVVKGLPTDLELAVVGSLRGDVVVQPIR
jgi:hypothetical protein